MCSDCQAANDTNYLSIWYNVPQCKYCAARLIKYIGKLRTPTSEEIASRRRVVLSEAIAWGHSESEIRALAKLGPWVQPVETKKR